MITLTETMVDIADCHTTLFYLSGQQPPASHSISLGLKDQFDQLHSSVKGDGTTAYADVFPGQPATIVDKVRHAYEPNKYWRRYADNDDFPTYGVEPWNQLLPLLLSLNSHIKFVNDGSFKMKVSPVPRVLLYPFGWSTWLSLRLTGPHTLPDLSKLVQYVFNQKAFEIDGGAGPVTLRDYFRTVASGVRPDIFGGLNTQDISSQDLITVTTVIAKNGGSPAFKSLQPPDSDDLLRIVKPEGPPPKKGFQSYVHYLSATDQLEVVIMDELSRFIWLEHLLKPVGRNRVWVSCYHANSVRTLVHALQMHRLIQRAGKKKIDLSAPLLELLETAHTQLTSPGYRNVSLRAFLETDDVKASIKKVENLV
jgi:hypothetical protein